jgi:hypothetical protein
MNEQTIIVAAPPANGTVEMSDSANALKSQLLTNLRLAEASAIDTSEKCRSAVIAVREAKTVLKQVERDRVSLKAPFLEIGKRIDSVAKQFAAEIEDLVKEVELRIGSYVAVDAAEQAKSIQEQKNKFLELESKRKSAEAAVLKANEAVQTAETEEERKKALMLQLDAEECLDEHEQNVASSVSKLEVMQTEAGYGGSQRYKVKVVVYDPFALAAAYPLAVKITPYLSIVKAMAENNPEKPIPGVEIQKQPIFNVK